MTETYTCYKRRVEDPSDKAAMARLDSVRNALEEACAAFSPAFHSYDFRLIASGDPCGIALAMRTGGITSGVGAISGLP